MTKERFYGRHGSAQFLIMALALGANKLPAGANGQLESVVERAAPEKCLLYFSNTPVAKANANSTNHAEIILADEGVQGFVSELKTQIASGIRQAAEINPGFAMIEQVDALSLVEIALTRPAAAYVERLTISKDGPPDMVAGLVFDCGERVDEVEKSVTAIVEIANRLGRVEIDDVKVSGAKLRRITEGETVVDFGFRDTLFIVTVGKETSADLLTRLDRTGAAPDWLTAMRAKAKIERVSNVFYFSGSAAQGGGRAAAHRTQGADLSHRLGGRSLRFLRRRGRIGRRRDRLAAVSRSGGLAGRLARIAAAFSR